MASSSHSRDEIQFGLWQGVEPERPHNPEPVGDVDALVLCYAECREWWDRFDGRPGLEVIRAPMQDDQRTMRPEDEVVALAAGAIVADRLRRGARVLVTCHMGFNRSGLVCALALFQNGMTMSAAIDRVRAARRGSLFNPAFVEFLERVGAR